MELLTGHMDDGSEHDSLDYLYSQGSDWGALALATGQKEDKVQSGNSATKEVTVCTPLSPHFTARAPAAAQTTSRNVGKNMFSPSHCGLPTTSLPTLNPVNSTADAHHTAPNTPSSPHPHTAHRGHPNRLMRHPHA